jgi:DNA ligase (NAD+)
MSQRYDLEQLYFQAKEAYYSGEPIMSDDEFDHLEKELITLGSDAPYIVGADDRKAKYSHPSPMLSLAKFQATLAGDPPTAQAQSWMDKIGRASFEISPKYDGNAANAIYQNGELLQVLTRGTGSKGRDITDKVKHNLPQIIGILGTVEVRGEVVIKVSTFNEKYSEFKNPRNYVAGVLNRDENTQEVLADLDFIPLEVKIHSDEGITYTSPNLPGFKFHPYVSYIGGLPGQFEDAYAKMLDYRVNTCEYQLDGFVIKAPNDMRPNLGENSHDPNWAVAIKFPPKEAITKIVSISWQYGKTGEVTPVAVMEPVDLDGSTVSRAALFNYGYLKSKGAFPGATVAIAKSGDIIPQITRVVVSGSEENLNVPKNCKCGSELILRGIHLMCENPTCENVAFNMFSQGINQLDLDGVGGSMIRQLWNAGYRSPVEILNPNKFTRERLFANSDLKPGKLVDNMFKEIEKITELKPAEVVLMLGFPGMGGSSAKQVGNMLSGLKYNFSGLEKNVISGFEPGEKKRELYESAIAEISQFINIAMPEKIADDAIPYEMTGSPKSFGFKTKEEFVAAAKAKGFYHASLKEAKVLFVDDLNTSSNKMKTAQSKGVKVMLYSEIL